MQHNEELIKEIGLNVREIRAQVTALVAQGAVLTKDTQEQKEESDKISARLAPLEKDYIFIKRLTALILIVMGSGALSAVAGVIKISVSP